MTPGAQKLLSKAIRSLRERLLSDLHDSCESTYRLSIGEKEAGLSEQLRTKRLRLEGWVREQERAEPGKAKGKRGTAELRKEVEKQAAYTLLNRLALIKLMEFAGLHTPFVVTGGWESRGYKDFRSLAPALVSTDQSEGYALLLQLIFEDLAVELPGLFGSAGVADLIPVPAPTLRHVVEVLDDPELNSCWTDDMTLGWIYQYWNDPERERLDAKLKTGGKLAAHEIASKTQMFTERYMVEWLVQNSLGRIWLSICRKHGWTPEAEADGTLDNLQRKKADWRRRRDNGEVALTDTMPLDTEAERRWAYYVEQPIPADAIDAAPSSIRELRVIDPALGSGHFLVILFDLLLALYKEESRHRSAESLHEWSLQSVVESILENNLYGIDLDARAVQIAAAALWLKAKVSCSHAQPRQLNLVASNLRLQALADNDPALVELRRAVEEESGIPSSLTDQIVQSLKGADHVGSLLRIDVAVDLAIGEHDTARRGRRTETQPTLFGDGPEPLGNLRRVSPTREGIVAELEKFLAAHTSASDIGLRLRGEQLAAGVRFIRMLREGQYDLVVGNPPYQGTSKILDTAYVTRTYPRGKSDLYAAFLIRGLELAKQEGTSALLTMRNWMFTKQYNELRGWLLSQYDLRALGDFAIGAFDEVANDRLTVAASIFRRAKPSQCESIAQQPTPPEDRSYDRERTQRKRASTQCGVGLYRFNTDQLSLVPWSPLIYWWGKEELSLYDKYQTVKSRGGSLQGISTADNPRFLRYWWEVEVSELLMTRQPISRADITSGWVPYVKGPAGRRWCEPLLDVLTWRHKSIDIRLNDGSAWRNDPGHFRLGVAFPRVGHDFSAREHRYASVFDAEGPTLLGIDPATACCLLNSALARRLISGLNPTIHFTQGDVDRLPIVPIPDSPSIFATISSAFSNHEQHREASIEFLAPGPSSWAQAQEWAQEAIDRPAGTQLAQFNPTPENATAIDHLSYAFGVAIGRFSPNHQGVLSPQRESLLHALPDGIMFLDGTLPHDALNDSLGHSACDLLRRTWDTIKPSLGGKDSLRDFLRNKFFAHHRSEKYYNNRPIYFPLSSEGKTFVAWVNIHRWLDSTLRLVIADHLNVTMRRIDGELNDLRAARDSADTKVAKAAERRYAKVLGWRDELASFISVVEQCAEAGPPQTTHAIPARECNSQYAFILDDGVVVNSAGLWPLLYPQWRDPKRWWGDIAISDPDRDYDWSRLAMRYWPSRVDTKCQANPSLAVAHGCLWRYHPSIAWTWELRLQDEVDPNYRVIETPYRGDGGHLQHRSTWISGNLLESLLTVEREALRRAKKYKRPISELRILEPGIWSTAPDACWALEQRVTEKQGSGFLLRAPDEAEARERFANINPDLVARRKKLITNLTPNLALFAIVDDDESTSEESDDDADPLSNVDEITA